MITAAPTPRPGIPVAGRPDRLVPRRALLERMRSDPASIVLVHGPAGSGKTVLLAQWAHADPRPTCWLTISPGHSDPVLLLGDLARALAAVHPTGPLSALPRRVAGSDALRSLARLSRALDEAETPTLIVLDDLHRLRGRTVLDIVATLADRLPGSSRIALAARARIDLPIARWELADRVLIVDPEDLRLDVAECGDVLEAIGVSDARRLAPDIHERTEGLAAAIHLIGLSLRRRADRSIEPDPLAGADVIDGYLRTEVLEPLDDITRRLLVRTSVVDVVTGPLADAVTDDTGSEARLAGLADADPLVTRTAPDGRSFRYHSLLRDLLVRELARDPATELDVRTRAASWFETQGLLDEAIHQALAGGDVDRAVRLVLRIAQLKYRAGEVVSLLGWIQAFDEATVERWPDLAGVAALIHALEGDGPAATHWAAVASRLQGVAAASDPTDPGPGIDLVDAVLCANGPERMLEDARRALDEHAEEWPWRSTAVYACGMAALMLREDDEAQARFAEVEWTHGVGMAVVSWAARAERALAAIAQRDWSAAASILDLDRETLLADPDSGRMAALLWHVADARLAVHRGDLPAAQDRLRRVELGRVRLSWALPWYAVRTLTELARVQLAVGDHLGARVTLMEARDILAARPLLGDLPNVVARLTEQALAADHVGPNGGSLTRAELRLLPLLQTYLTIKEIGERLGVSANTAKTQALSIYGKLGASTRTEAVEAAVRRGLLEDILA
jgi:LuxR family maltose regulon positive regulatory protein